MPPTVITCARCHESKPEDAFPPSHRQRQHPYCIPCFAAADEEWLEEERKRRLAREEARQEAPPALGEWPARRRRKKTRFQAPPAPSPLGFDVEDAPGALVAKTLVDVARVAPDAPKRLVAEDAPQDPPAPAEESPVPVNRFQAMGRARTPVKAQNARENGKRGGRPRKWSRKVLALVAGWIRRELESEDALRWDADMVPSALIGINERQELQHLAQALEAGKVR